MSGFQFKATVAALALIIACASGVCAQINPQPLPPVRQAAGQNTPQDYSGQAAPNYPTPDPAYAHNQNVPYNNPAVYGYGEPADPSATPTLTPASATEAFSTVSNIPDDNADLAKRLANVEGQLKKINDKAKADKEAAAKVPSVKLGGRVQWDTDTFSQNGTSITTAGDALNGSEFRRLYLSASGAMFDTLDYKVEVDLVPSHISWKDVYLQMHDLPVMQNVRAGHFYTPFGLETETSDLNMVFVERSLLDQLGGIGSRHAGVMTFGNAFDERSWWGIGAFATQFNEQPPTFPVTGFDDDSQTAIYGRMTFLPWYDEATEGRGLWEVGISGESGGIPSIRTAGTTRYSLQDRPEAHLAPNVVFTGDLPDANYVNALNVESALVYGPLSFQAEYEWITVHRTAHADPTFNGGYIFVSYFLTGENRVFNRKSATFGRIIPFGNFFRVRDEDGCIQMGKGAWELGYRCSYVDLNNAGVFGGIVVDHTIGLNWYLNPYAKLMFDYIHSDAHDMVKNNILYANTSELNAFVTRMQFDF
jgi:phosphate-selective porin OprO and OprP